MYELTAADLGPEFFQSAKHKLAALPRHAWGSPATCDYDKLALVELVAKLLSENYTLRRDAYLAKVAAVLPTTGEGKQELRLGQDGQLYGPEEGGYA